MKGIEGMAFKYVIMIITALIVVSLFISMTQLFTETVTGATVTMNQTFLEVLDKTLGI